MSRVITRYPLLGPIAIPGYSRTLLKKGYVAFSYTVQQMNPQILDWPMMHGLWAEWLVSKHLPSSGSVMSSQSIEQSPVLKAQGIAMHRASQDHIEIKFEGFGIPNIMAPMHPIPTALQDDQGSVRQTSASKRPAQAIESNKAPENARSSKRQRSIFEPKASKNTIEDHKKALEEAEGGGDVTQFNEDSENDQTQQSHRPAKPPAEPPTWWSSTDASRPWRHFPPLFERSHTPKFRDHSSELWSTSGTDGCKDYKTYLFQETHETNLTLAMRLTSQ